MNTAITVLALSLLGHEDFTVREWAESAARSCTPHHRTIDAMLSQCESPEAVVRLRRLRSDAVVRECDRLAVLFGGYPRADWQLGWPEDQEYWDWNPPPPPPPGWPPEFYQARNVNVYSEGGWRDYQMSPDDAAFMHRTRHALIQYANRTGNWAVVRYYLGGQRWQSVFANP